MNTQKFYLEWDTYRNVIQIKIPRAYKNNDEGKEFFEVPTGKETNNWMLFQWKDNNKIFDQK